MVQSSGMESSAVQASRDQSQQLICFAQWASVAVTALGALVLVGWTIDSSPLKRILPGLVAMNPATAIAFIASGLALRLLSRPSIPPRVRHVAWSCTALTVVIAVTRLLAYAAGIDVGFDRLLFPEELARDHVPNRMAPNTAASFLLLGLGLLLLDVRTRRGHRPTEWCGVSALLIGLLTLVGYAFYIVSFRQVASYIPMALHTGAGFVLISAALLCARPDQGFMATLSGAGMGSQLARRLLPFAIGIPFGLGWLRLQGQDLGLYDTEFGLALTVLSSSLIFAVLIWWNARSLNRMDAGRRRAEQLERETISLEATLSERRRTERLKDQLLDIIAHELRIPVAVVQEGVNQLADGVLGPLNSDQQEGVALSRENIERLTVLIEKAVVATQLLTERVRSPPADRSTRTGLSSACRTSRALV
ncbi:MAG: hypothetical protein HYZ89_05035 [Candidatus Omnitrophica bacterium]|nr:hypothetical protein [Candidatus Omnitrophota bacterium]